MFFLIWTKWNYAIQANLKSLFKSENNEEKQTCRVEFLHKKSIILKKKNLIL